MINRLEIKNFRSIKSMVLEPKNLCALIGPNSSGKSNILKAMDLLLGEGWTTQAKVAKELFNDVNKSIKIVASFREPVVYSDSYGEKEAKTVELTMTLKPELKASTTVNGGKIFYGQSHFKKTCHFIYISNYRDLRGQLRISEWTLLGKLMKVIYENYASEFEGEDALKKRFKDLMEEPKKFLEADFNESREVVTFKNFIDTFKKYCGINSAGLATEFKPKLNIYNPNWFYKTLQIHIREEFPDKDFEALEVGSGMQNLLLISLFQTYAELMGGRVIFGIEEPEISLHPQAERGLFKTLQDLSLNTQIFYTTHSPNFVSAERSYEIELLSKSEKKGSFLRKKDQMISKEYLESSKFKIYTHFNSERNELFFAKQILLVEGDADKILFETLSEKKWKVDISRQGISIIECGGKGGVIYFIGVCRLLGITNFFAVWDEDSEDNYEDGIDNLQYADKQAKGLQIPDTLEKFLGLPAGKDAKKVKNAYEWASNVETDQIPSFFDPVKDFFVSDEVLSDADNQDVEDDVDKLTVKTKEEDIPF